MNEKIRYDIFISGKFVDLFVLTEEHALHADWYNWYNDAETTRYTEHHRFPNTPIKQLDFFKTNIETSSQKLQLGIMDKNKYFLGVVSLNTIDYISRRAEMAITIGEKAYRKLIYAAESVSLIIEHGFFTLNLERIYAGTTEKSLADFWIRSLNFTYEGMYRKHIYRNGIYHDAHLFGILRNEFSPFVYNDIEK